MITDYETNLVYLSGELLKPKYRKFYARFTEALKSNSVEFQMLPNTKDIWAVDYMPIQTGENKFVRFIYKPDYLCKNKRDYKTITAATEVCAVIHIPFIKSDIILDGGNVVRSKSKVIMTEKVFSENPHYKSGELIDELENLFQAEVVIIPFEEGDWIAHADGEVRLLNDDAVVINRSIAERKKYTDELKQTLKPYFKDIIEVPFSPQYRNEEDASGYYINYLEAGEKIFLPIFDIEEDESAFGEFESIFKGRKVIPVRSEEISVHGGVLNCITWNIKK